jgi:hypothetical protein
MYGLFSHRPGWSNCRSLQLSGQRIELADGGIVQHPQLVLNGALVLGQAACHPRQLRADDAGDRGKAKGQQQNGGQYRQGLTQADAPQ